MAVCKNSTCGYCRGLEARIRGTRRGPPNAIRRECSTDSIATVTGGAGITHQCIHTCIAGIVMYIRDTCCQSCLCSCVHQKSPKYNHLETGFVQVNFGIINFLRATLFRDLFVFGALRWQAQGEWRGVSRGIRTMPPFRFVFNDLTTWYPKECTIRNVQ